MSESAHDDGGDEPAFEDGLSQDTSESPKGRHSWRPEATVETAAALRRLALTPWLVSERDDDAIAAVRRNLPAIRETIERLGWVLIVERGFIRLRKSPPTRRNAWSADAPHPIQASWFFLLLAGAETVAPRVALAQLVTAARAAAAEAGIAITNDIAERRGIVRAMRMLEARGVVMQVDGDVEGFVENENAPVLVAVYHSRVAHVIANFGSADPVAEPALWLEQVERQPDPARRMRRRLIDDTLVPSEDLDDTEADWLSRRVRGDDGTPLAAAFGLRLERRVEGAAFVVPEGAFRHLHELGPTPFPAPGTVPHAALMLCEHAALSVMLGSADQKPGTGWRGIPESRIEELLAALAKRKTDGRGEWRRELAENPKRLAEEVRTLLTSLDLLRFQYGPDGTIWWFSPATGRWSLPQSDRSNLLTGSLWSTADSASDGGAE